MAAAPVLFRHPSSLDHETGAHPEQAARIVAIERALIAREWAGYVPEESQPAGRDALLRVHPESHVARIEGLAAAGGGSIDADTFVSAGSFEAALHAAGGAVELVERVMAGAAPTGFSVHRPPGHHAEPAVAMGFCLFNNVAVAARHATDALGLERVMIVDYDVHHGNGTNAVFHSDPRVLFVSIHQSPLYPGTGPASDVGSGAGKGFTVNLPVPPGSGDDVYVPLVDHVVVPLARSWSPELVLISAGYDAHYEDPLADCRVTEEGFAAMARSMSAACSELEVPLGCVLEGGYALGPLARSVAATMEALVDGGGASAAAELVPLARGARERLTRWWPALA